MLEVMYELSKYIPPSPNQVDGIEVDLVSADYVLLIEFDKNGAYKGVSGEEFDTSNTKKYFSRKKSKNRYLTPTVNVSDKNVKGVMMHVLQATKTLSEALESSLIKKVYDELDNSDKRIIEDLEKKISEIEGKKILVTLRVGGKYMSEIKEFVEATRVYLSSKGRFEEASEGICSMCGQRKLVSGNNSPYTFYTIDKPGYIVGGMREEVAWKNFPLCFDCRMKLDAVKNYINSHLSFTFAGVQPYKLIPSFYTNNTEFIKEVIGAITRGQKSIDVDSESSEIFYREEGFIKYLVDNYGDQNLFSVNLFFLNEKRGSAQERIKFLIQDVYPSRLKEIFDNRRKVNKWIDSLMGLRAGRARSSTQATVSANREYYIRMSEFVKFFTSEYNRLQGEFPFEREFYKVVESIFLGTPFDEKTLFRLYMLSLRKLFYSLEEDYRGSEDQNSGTFSIKKKKAKQNNFYDEVLKSYFSYVFVKLCVEGGYLMYEFSSLDELLNSLKGLGSNPVAKGIFLTGVLTQRVLDYQRKIGTKAFFSKLRDLVLNKEDIMRIFSQVENKLSEYDEFLPIDREIYEKASEIFSFAESDWKMSIDEISYCFALGLGMKENVYGFMFNLKKKKEEGE